MRLREALYVREGLECREATISSGTVESLGVRIKGQSNDADVSKGVYCRSPGPDNNTNGTEGCIPFSRN